MGDECCLCAARRKMRTLQPLLPEKKSPGSMVLEGSRKVRLWAPAGCVRRLLFCVVAVLLVVVVSTVSVYVADKIKVQLACILKLYNQVGDCVYTLVVAVLTLLLPWVVSTQMATCTWYTDGLLAFSVAFVVVHFIDHCVSMTMTVTEKNLRLATHMVAFSVLSWLLLGCFRLSHPVLTPRECGFLLAAVTITCCKDVHEDCYDVVIAANNLNEIRKLIPDNVAGLIKVDEGTRCAVSQCFCTEHLPDPVINRAEKTLKQLFANSSYPVILNRDISTAKRSRLKQEVAKVDT